MGLSREAGLSDESDDRHFDNPFGVDPSTAIGYNVAWGESTPNNIFLVHAPMATSGQLVQITAKALRLPEVTVELHYRALRKAGLVQKGGRGRSARQIEALDASRLLIALMGAGIVKEVPEAVERIGRFKHTRGEVDRTMPMAPPNWMPDGHPFEDAMARTLTDLSRLPVSRDGLHLLARYKVSVDLEDAKADISLPDGLLHYEGEPPRRPFTRGLCQNRTLYIDGLLRLSRALPAPACPGG